MRKIFTFLFLVLSLFVSYSYASLRFVNASTSRVAVGTTNLFGDQGTLIFWFRPTTLDTGTESIIDHSAIDFSHYAGLGYDTTAGSLNFYKRRGSFTGIEINTTAFLTVNQWEYIAVVWDINAADSAQKIYHGTLTSIPTEVSYTTQTAGTGTPTAPSGGLVCYIGNNQNNDNSMGGDIFSMAIWNRVLSLGEITAQKARLYNTQGIQRLWIFGTNGTSGLTDYSGNTANGTGLTNVTVTSNAPLGSIFSF